VSKFAALLVDQVMPLKEALVLMDRGGEGFLAVQSETRTVVGVITDGDVRRALIGNVPLSAPVSQVMNRHFKSWPADDSYEAALSYLKTHNYRQLPVINAQGELVDILFSNHPPALLRKNPVVIMAGGLGTRLRPFTETVPKPMLRVGDKPFLQGILENLIAQGFCRFYFCVNYLAEQIVDHFKDGKQWGVEISYVHEKQRLGTAGALALIEEPGQLPLLVMNGDLLTKVDFASLLDHHATNQNIATMAVRQMEFQIPFGVVSVNDARISDMVEKPVNTFLVNAGIYVIDPACLSAIPKDEMFDMPTLLEQFLDSSQGVGYFPLFESWMDIGRIEDYQHALKTHAAPGSNDITTA